MGDVALSYTKGPRGRALAAPLQDGGQRCLAVQQRPAGALSGHPIPSVLWGRTRWGKSNLISSFRKILFEYSPILEQVRRAAGGRRTWYTWRDLPTLPIGVMLKEVLGCTLMVDCHEWWYKQTRLWGKHLGREDRPGGKERGGALSQV